MRTSINSSKILLFSLFIEITVFVVAACNNCDNSSTDKASTDFSNMARTDSSKLSNKQVKKCKASARVAAVSSNKIAKDKQGVYYKTDINPEFPGGAATS